MPVRMSVLFDPSGAASLTQQAKAEGSQTENVDSALVSIFQHATLPCGSVLPNRLVKVSVLFKPQSLASI